MNDVFRLAALLMEINDLYERARTLRHKFDLPVDERRVLAIYRGGEEKVPVISTADMQKLDYVIKELRTCRLITLIAIAMSDDDVVI